MNANTNESSSKATSDRRMNLEAMDDQLTQEIQPDQDIAPDADVPATDYEQDSTESGESASSQNA
jgi:hypothetical protein